MALRHSERGHFFQCTGHAAMFVNGYILSLRRVYSEGGNAGGADDGDDVHQDGLKTTVASDYQS